MDILDIIAITQAAYIAAYNANVEDKNNEQNIYGRYRGTGQEQAPFRAAPGGERRPNSREEWLDVQAVKRCASCITKANYSGRVAIYKCSDGYGYGVAEYRDAEDTNGEQELFSLRTSPGSNEPAANIEAYIRSVLRV